MQLKLAPPLDFREPGDPEATARHLDLLTAGRPSTWLARLAAGRDLVPREPPAPGSVEQRLRADVEMMRLRGFRYWLPDGVARLGALGACSPRLLFVHGVPDLVAPAVAIVGTRRPDAYGVDLTARIATAVAECGATVVSGGALGIDAVAHEAALDAGGRTVVVLGSGLGRPHPGASRPLFWRAAGSPGSGVVSEYTPAMPVLPAQFPERNRLVAALADAVVVVQAGAGSGALITAGWARRVGVPVLVVPGDVWYERSAGAIELHRLGARVLASPRDLAAIPALARINEARWPEPGTRPHGLPAGWLREAAAPAPSEAACEVLGALAAGPLGVDELAARTGKPLGQVQARLLELEVAGRVRRLAGGLVVAV